MTFLVYDERLLTLITVFQMVSHLSISSDGPTFDIKQAGLKSGLEQKWKGSVKERREADVSWSF